MIALPTPADRAVVRRLDGGLGAAAERFARLTLKKSPQTQATYRSSYRRFAAWLSDYTGSADPSPQAFTADALADYLELLEQDKSPSTVKKERAALNRLTRYLHSLGAIDATEILMIEGSRGAGPSPTRDALDQATWDRVKNVARARLVQGPRGRTSREAAARDLALILVLGEMGLRSEEARSLTLASIRPKRADGITPWLRVHGKGDKIRDLPIPLEVADAVLAWQQHHRELFAAEPLLFPRLGSRRREGGFPDAGGAFTSQALGFIVKPIMLAAGVPAELAHPHVLRHTYGTLFMRRPRARLERLRELRGHASIDTTAVYVHHTHDDLEQAVLDNQPNDDILTAHHERRRRRTHAR